MENNLKNMKREISELKRDAADVTIEISKLEKRLTSEKQLVSSLESSAAASQESQQQTIKAYAREEASESDLQNASSVLNNLQQQIITHQSVIKIIQGDLKEAQARMEGLHDRIERFLMVAWDQVFASEVERLIVPMSRLYAAYCSKNKGRHLGYAVSFSNPGSSFVDPLIKAMNQSVDIEKTTAVLAKEYGL